MTRERLPDRSRVAIVLLLAITVASTTSMVTTADTSWAAASVAASPSAYEIDQAFVTETGTGANGTIRTMATSPVDGSILITGAFTEFDGIPSPGITRLDASGRIDAAFSAAVGLGADGPIRSADALSDGRWAVVGNFTHFNGQPVTAIAVLLPSGGLDTSFSARGGTGFGAATNLKAVAVDSHDRIVVCGDSLISYDGVPVLTVARLLPNGLLDPEFAPTPGAGFDLSSGPATVAVDGLGGIIVPGGISVAGVDDASSIIRLLDGGTVDAAFTHGADSRLAQIATSISVDAVSGSLSLGGPFARAGGIKTIGVARYQEDGTFDPAFMSGPISGPDGVVYDVASDPWGGVIVAGLEIDYDGAREFSDTVRFAADGSFDIALTDLLTQLDHCSWTVGVDDAGGILVAGEFTAIGAIPVGRIVRILPTAFAPGVPLSTTAPDAVPAAGTDPGQLAATGLDHDHEAVAAASAAGLLLIGAVLALAGSAARRRGSRALRPLSRAE